MNISFIAESENLDIVLGCKQEYVLRFSASIWKLALGKLSLMFTNLTIIAQGRAIDLGGDFRGNVSLVVDRCRLLGSGKDNIFLFSQVQVGLKVSVEIITLDSLVVNFSNFILFSATSMFGKIQFSFVSRNTEFTFSSSVIFLRGYIEASFIDNFMTIYRNAAILCVSSSDSFNSMTIRINNSLIASNSKPLFQCGFNMHSFISFYENVVFESLNAPIFGSGINIRNIELNFRDCFFTKTEESLFFASLFRFFALYIDFHNCSCRES
jgi:hypothetical protein